MSERRRIYKGLIWLSTAKSKLDKIAPRVQKYEVYLNDKLFSPNPSKRVHNYGSFHPFAWGYGGPGPQQLALAILLNESQSYEIALRLSKLFVCDIIANLNVKGPWELTSDYIKAWMLAHGVTPEELIASSGPPGLMGELATALQNKGWKELKGDGRRG